MAGGCRGECAVANFKLEHDQPHLFVNSQWPRYPQLVYLVWRLVTALFFVIWIVMSGTVAYSLYTVESNRIKWFIYLTNWMFFALTIDTCWHLGLVIHAYHACKKGEAPPTVMPWYYKVTWVLYNVSTNLGITVTIMFWALLYNPDDDLDFISVGKHGLNSVYIVVDLCITGLPVRIHHFFHGVIFSIVYLLFSVVYVMTGGTGDNDSPYIYSIMDWNTDPIEAAIYTVASVVGIIIIWIIIYGLYWIRRAVYNACCYPNDISEAHELSHPKEKREVNNAITVV